MASVHHQPPKPIQKPKSHASVPTQTLHHCMQPLSARAIPRVPFLSCYITTPQAYNSMRTIFILQTESSMAEQRRQEQQQQLQPVSHPVVKAATAATAGGSMLLLSGLTLAGTVIALTVATPLLVIFSPVLVPAMLTVSLVVLGFVASGGFGVAGISVLTWMYKFMTGKPAPGADQLEQARQKMAAKAREAKEMAQSRLEQGHQGS